MKFFKQTLPFCALLLALYLLVSCEKMPLEREPLSAGFEYVPIEVGNYQIFSVKQTIYRINETPLNLHYQLKEVVHDSFKSEGGKTAYRLFRYRRSTPLQNWALDSVFTARVEQDHIVRNEHNIELVKLRFPLTEGKRWNGNIYNTLGVQNYTIRDLNKPLSVNGTAYEKTLRVIAQEDSSKIDKKVLFELYAHGTGLIYKKHEYLLYCNPDNPEQSDCFGKKIIESGIISEVILLESGKE